MIDEPLGAFMYRSSIILDLSHSGLFHGQLLTVLGSPSNFHGCRTPRCDYVSVINTHRFGDSGRFLGLLLSVLGSQSNFND